MKFVKKFAHKFGVKQRAGRPVVLAQINDQDCAAFELNNGQWYRITPLVGSSTVHDWEMQVNPPVVVSDAELCRWLDKAVQS